MPLDVICAGFGRTGTLSLKAALDELGLHCYHFTEIVEHKEDIDRWVEATTAIFEQGGSYDFEQIFAPADPPGRKPYRAGADCPVCVFYKQLMQQYPEAKVILTVRDSPEAWHRSQLNTVHRFSTQMNVLVELFLELRWPWRRKQVAVDKKWWSPWVYDARFPDPAFAKQLYEERITEVCAAVPPERLLIFNVKEGWKPLCDFLGLPVPADKPFPCVNTSADAEKRMLDMQKKLHQMAAAAAAGGLVLLAAGVAATAVLIRRRQ